jgi:ATP-dependent Zn protease
LYIWFVIQNNPAEFRAKVMSYIGGEGVAKEWSPPWGEKIVTFEDVKGCDEAREELQEFVDFRSSACAISSFYA